jgi:hypothetical protein
LITIEIRIKILSKKGLKKKKYVDTIAIIKGTDPKAWIRKYFIILSEFSLLFINLTKAIELISKKAQTKIKFWFEIAIAIDKTIEDRAMFFIYKENSFFVL